MSLIQPTRRRLIAGLAALIAAPAIVRFEALMPIKALAPEAYYCFVHPNIYADLLAATAGYDDCHIKFDISRMSGLRWT